jgi:hypothetical protein
MLSARAFGLLAAGSFISVSLIAGCMKSSNPTETTTIDAESTTDAAQSISEAFSQYNGGAFDQIADVTNIATEDGLPGDLMRLISGAGFPQSITKSYDSVTGWWTVTINRNYSTKGQAYSSDYHRVYKYKYLNSQNALQKNYIVKNNGVPDTAYQIIQQIVEGTGESSSPRVSHKLLSLSGTWVVTDANKKTVTLNTLATAPYYRQASDTVNTVGGAVRTLNNSLTVNLINVTGLRGSGLNWYEKSSGTISGTYHATVTFQKGATYRDTTIDKTFTITLGGTRPRLNIGGRNFAMDPIFGDIY